MNVVTVVTQANNQWRVMMHDRDQNMTRTLKIKDKRADAVKWEKGSECQKMVAEYCKAMGY